MKVRVDLGTGESRVPRRARDAALLAEKEGGGRSPRPRSRASRRTTCASSGASTQDETLYGLGQQQLGLVDIKGYDLDLWQRNATVVVPFLVSSRGYGILWDNTSYTRFGDLRDVGADPGRAALRRDGQGRAASPAPTSPGATSRRPSRTRVDAAIDIGVAGRRRKQPNRQIHPALPPERADQRPLGGRGRADRDGRPPVPALLEQRRSACGSTAASWSTTGARAGCRGSTSRACRLEKGRRHALKVEWSKDQGMETVRLKWKTPARSADTSLWSEVGDGVDYYFVYGPSLDERRRRLPAADRRGADDAALGVRPLAEPPALRDGSSRASTRSTGSARAGSRSTPSCRTGSTGRETAWGSHEFDPARFPDPDGWVKAIHDRTRAADDLGLGQVLPRHRELRGDAGEGLPVRAAP